ncbi:hypothetical protein D9619_011032 [Psilocybe cf. subviscida]|uniref:F-box domain-containing protein n=1 Tax=Psilocybe cf. subviscida TaxID=2480587 RepID=A0A8H5BAA0_9AGAR|nr:hypothetical protein D9619_011032 [Psilocybe cf. subviscida]
MCTAPVAQPSPGHGYIYPRVRHPRRYRHIYTDLLSLCSHHGPHHRSASMPSASTGASKAKAKTKAPAPSSSSKSRGVPASSAPPGGSTTTTSKPPATSRRAPLLHSRSSLVPHGATPSTGPGSSSTIKKQSLSAQHPRTDPLGALTHLLKLLAALPTRIGGCAYRLTPAEHALATHLVGVLDPYVCHGARALGVASLSSSSDPASGTPSTVTGRMGSTGTLNGLVNQPTEILDAVLSHLDDRRDLRSAGLTCRRVAGVVFPRHYEYRVIRCKVSDIAVWHHLARNRALARNVRRVEIIDERGGMNAMGGGERLLIPRGIVNSNTDLENTSSTSSSSDSDAQPATRAATIPGRGSRSGLPFALGMHAKQEKLLAAALSRMTGLTHFHWASAHAPIQLLRAVWPALMRSATTGGGRLRVVELCDNLMFAPRRVESEESEDSDENRSSSSDSEADGEADGENDDRSDSASEVSQVSRRARIQKRQRAPAASMLNMETVRFRSTAHAYGAAKQPDLSRIASVLHQCGNLKDLEITYTTPRAQGLNNNTAAINVLGTPTARARPLADELLLYGRWTHLTTLTLVNLRCASPVAPSSFLSVHMALEVLHLVINIQTAAGVRPLQLAPGALPRLREIKASKEVINAVLECPVDVDETLATRPLEVVKGFKLAGSYNSNQNPANTAGSRTVPDSIFLENLKIHSATLRRVELAGWHDMEDVRRLAGAAPHLQHLDVGRRLGHNAHASRPAGSGNTGGGADRSGPATNMVEWAELLSTLPELTAMHGVRFFYEVSSVAIGGTLVVSNGITVTPTANASAGSSTSNTTSNSTSGPTGLSDPPVATTTTMSTATLTREMPSGGNAGKPPAQMSMMDRSRMRKNDEIAGVLAWKCRKLRRVDHWEENSGKVIVLTRDHDGGKDREKDRDRESKVRWEVRRIKYL